MWVHIQGLSFTLKSWAEFLVFMSAVCAWPLPEATSTTVNKPEVSFHVFFNFSRLCSGSPTLHYGSSSPLHGAFTCFHLRKMLECAHLKFMVYCRGQANKHTHTRVQCSPASVGLAQAHLNKHVGISCNWLTLVASNISLSLQFVSGEGLWTHRFVSIGMLSYMYLYTCMYCNCPISDRTRCVCCIYCRWERKRYVVNVVYIS